MLDALLPADCFVCSAALPEAQLLGACPGCWTGLRPIRPPFCPDCGAPQPAGTDLLGPAGGRCAGCLLRPLALDRVRAAVVYDDVARRFLWRAKLGLRPELLEVFGAQLAGALLADGAAADGGIVVPVPSHPLARLRRGFDPAEPIARAVARRLGLPLDRRGLVRRVIPTAAAKRLDAAERRRALKHAFRAARARGGRVLLVDDVLTTGATAEGCAAALRTAGAERVGVAVWARTPEPSSGAGVV